MTKKQAIERVRELNRQTRMLQDQALRAGDSVTVDRLGETIVQRNVFIMKLGKLDAKRVNELVAIHSL